MPSKLSVTKAIIPAAGLGTRFLPATKSIPKEMLTLVDSPAIFYVVEEAVLAGIQDIILIQGRGKAAIEDFFDVSYELEDKLAKDGKTEILERLNRIKGMANIISIRQKQPLGLGHAVLCGKPIVGNEPFAVLLGDEVMVQNKGEPNVIQLLVDNFNRSQISTIAVMPVSDAEVSKYGIADVESINQKSIANTNTNTNANTNASTSTSTNSSANISASSGTSSNSSVNASDSNSNNGRTGDEEFIVRGLIEKPKPTETTSRWALPGRYVFDAKIFKFLEQTKPGKNGEIQLTDAMAQMLIEYGMRAIPVKSKRFDAGDPLGFIKANIEMALLHPQLGPEVKAYIEGVARRF